MSNFRYNENAQALEEDLVDILEEASRESAVKEAEEQSAKKAKASGGLDRILSGRTPVDEVKAILEEQGIKSAEQEILEHDVRRGLRKVARKNQDRVENFITASKG